MATYDAWIFKSEMAFGGDFGQSLADLLLDMASTRSLEEPNDPESIQKSFARHLEYSLACTRFKFTMQEPLSLTVFLLIYRFSIIFKGPHIHTIYIII